MRSSICSPLAFKLRAVYHLCQGDEYASVARYTPFPFIIIHVHCVPGFVSSFGTVSSTPDMQSKDWLGVQVWLS